MALWHFKKQMGTRNSCCGQELNALEASCLWDDSRPPRIGIHHGLDSGVALDEKGRASHKTASSHKGPNGHPPLFLTHLLSVMTLPALRFRFGGKWANQIFSFWLLGSNLWILAVYNTVNAVTLMGRVAKIASKPYTDSICYRMITTVDYIVEQSSVRKMLQKLKLSSDSFNPN